VTNLLANTLATRFFLACDAHRVTKISMQLARLSSF